MTEKFNNRLLSKLALVGKIDDFCADLAANFESIWEHMVEKFDAKDAKNGNFNNQMEFRKKFNKDAKRKDAKKDNFSK